MAQFDTKPTDSARIADATDLMPPPSGRPPERIRDPLPDHADVVVIGGGVIGTAVAHQVAEAGMRVVLVELADLASGASGRNAGMVYQGSYVTDGRSVIPLAVLTNQMLGEYTTLWGDDAFDYDRCGDLDLLLDVSDPRGWHEHVDGEQSHGLDATLIDGDQAREICPSLSRKVVGARWCPSDAKIIPYKLCFTQARAAERAGAHLATWTRVTGIETAAGAGSALTGRRITAVVTDRGAIATDWVVDAANAWSPQIAAMLGIYGVPITPGRGQILVTVPGPVDIPVNLCMRGEYWRQAHGGQVVLGGGFRRDLDVQSFKKTVDPVAAHTYTTSAVDATPAIGAMPVVRMWAGTMGFTPDKLPIIGHSVKVGGYIYATGFGGVGNAYSAGAGRVVCELLHGYQTAVSLEGASPARFDV